MPRADARFAAGQYQYSVKVAVRPGNSEIEIAADDTWV